MTRLYIANATSQVQQFQYWFGEQTRHVPIIQEIPLGGQIQVPGMGRDIPNELADEVIEQHRRYGLMSAAEALKAKTFSGIVYSLDKPVSLPVLHELVNKFRGILTERGRQLRTEAAIATNDFIEGKMFEEQIPGRLNTLEMSVEEEERGTHDDSPELSEGVRVFRPRESVEPRGRGRKPLSRRS